MKKIVQNTRTGRRIIRTHNNRFEVRGETVLVHATRVDRYTGKRGMSSARWFVHEYHKSGKDRWALYCPEYSFATKRSAMASAIKLTK